MPEARQPASQDGATQITVVARAERPPAPQRHARSIDEVPEIIARFDFRRVLGSGAFGTVWAAYDAETSDTVALKVLHRVDGEILYRFKEEFRGLAGITHPHLVGLRELFCVEDHWFFTMELVEGLGLRAYVKGEEGPPGSSSLSRDVAVSANVRRAWSASGPSDSLPSLSPHGEGGDPDGAHRPFDEGRLRAAMVQLTQGVAALHDHGKLHCDLKPSNVLVTEHGRVVICDFGLVSEIGGVEREPGVRELVGTPGYIAPEQILGEVMTQASDWYAVGVILYEMLAGRRPFTGSATQVFAAKVSAEAPPLAELAPAAPEELVRLATDLVRMDPAERPSGAEVLRRLAVLEAPPAVRVPSRPPAALSARSILVGRGAELAQLLGAFRRVEQGEPAAVHVRGMSGFGKSALVARFFERLRDERPDAVILEGRCYENEWVPYKSLDSLVDALTRYLLRLPEEDVDALIPDDVFDLARLFPVLRRVPAVDGAPRPQAKLDPSEVRKRAFAALRELLSRIGKARPLVLYVDDLQWGDLDSASFFRELFAPPTRPTLLLLEGFREEDFDASEVLAVLCKPSDNPAARALTVDVHLGPLREESATELAAALLGGDAAETRAEASAIAAESLGSPLFVRELVELARHLGGFTRRAQEGVALSLEAVMMDRVARLASTDRALLEAVCVAGVPTPLRLVQRAAGVTSGVGEAVAALRQGHWIKARGARKDQVVEAYHDRVRENVVRGMTESARRRVHAALAGALAETDDADPEALAKHLLAAGEVDAAWKNLTLAAERAKGKLAFARAASLYEQALALQPGRDALALTVRLAEALADGGRCAAAAAAYGQAVRLMEDGGHDDGSAKVAGLGPPLELDLVELKRRVAEQYLRSGHLDEGLAAARTVLAIFQIGLPATALRALIYVVVFDMVLRLRGLAFHQRSEGQIPPALLRRLDVCFSLSMGLSSTDNIRGADFNTRSLLLALRAGEPLRVVRALSVQICQVSSWGTSARARCAKMLEVAARLCEENAHVPALRGWLLVASGVAGYMMGDFLPSEEHFRACEALWESHSAGMSLELSSVRHYRYLNLEALGRIKEFARMVPATLAEALDKGDLFGATNMRLGTNNAAWLADDTPGEARRHAEEAAAAWSREGVHLQHFLEFEAFAKLDLYEGKGHAALRGVQRRWAALAGSMLLRVQVLRVRGLQVRANAAVAAASQERSAAEARRLLAQARADGRRLLREPAVYANAMGELVFAALARARGDDGAAADRLRRALDGFDRAHMGLYAAIARRRLGEVIGGEEGRAMVEGANAFMAGETIRSPARWSAMIAPGFPDRGP